MKNSNLSELEHIFGTLEEVQGDVVELPKEFHITDLQSIILDLPTKVTITKCEIKTHKDILSWVWYLSNQEGITVELLRDFVGVAGEISNLQVHQVV